MTVRKVSAKVSKPKVEKVEATKVKRPSIAELKAEISKLEEKVNLAANYIDLIVKENEELDTRLQEVSKRYIKYLEKTIFSIVKERFLKWCRRG